MMFKIDPSPLPIYICSIIHYNPFAIGGATTFGKYRQSQKRRLIGLERLEQ